VHKPVKNGDVRSRPDGEIIVGKFGKFDPARIDDNQFLLFILDLVLYHRPDNGMVLGRVRTDDQETF